MTFLVIAYLLVGVVIYAVTNTSSISSRVSSSAVLPSYGFIQKYLAVFVIFLWPVWLLVKPKSPA